MVLLREGRVTQLFFATVIWGTHFFEEIEPQHFVSLCKQTYCCNPDGEFRRADVLIEMSGDNLFVGADMMGEARPLDCVKCRKILLKRLISSITVEIDPADLLPQIPNDVALISEMKIWIEKWKRMGVKPKEPGMWIEGEDVARLADWRAADKLLRDEKSMGMKGVYYPFDEGLLCAIMQFRDWCKRHTPTLETGLLATEEETRQIIKETLREHYEATEDGEIRRVDG
jgi:hypothetical protein